VTFHLDAWGRRRLTPALAAKARDIMGRLGLESTWVLHGCAFLMRGEAVVVAGPPGLGKSRVLFDLERKREGRAIDDGLVLVGLRNGRLWVVETGTLSFARRGFRISLALRRLLRIDRSLFSQSDPLRTRRGRFLYWLLCRVAELAFKLNVLLPRSHNAPHDPRAIPLARIISIPHADDPFPSFCLDGGESLRALGDLRAEFAPYGDVQEISPLGSRADVARRMRKALLAPAAT